MSKQSKDYLDEKELEQLEIQYKSAMDILSANLNVLISGYEKQNGNIKSVEHSTRRIKKIPSAINKLKKKNFEVSAYQINKQLGDMVGVRLVCPFLEDVYEIVDLIKSSDAISVYDCKDYIQSPKKSGYRSYHLLVEVPVPDGDKQKKVKCEIQVRTLAMDAWAAMEHRIKYKPIGSKKLTDRQKEMLINCAKAFKCIEEYMTHLHLEKHVVSDSRKNASDLFDSVISESEKNDLNFECSSALKILEAFLDSEIRYYNSENDTKAVEHINSRVKTNASITRKLAEKGLDVNIDNIRNNINDGAAIRLVCPFIEDVYEMVKLINNASKYNEDCPIRVYEERDYITNPKKSGYRGYHLLVEVVIPGQDKKVKAEIQIRTLAMDAWAAMEDRIKYNQDYYYTDEQKSMLQICADTFAQVEEYMSCLLHPEDVKARHVLDEYFSGYEEEENEKKNKVKKKTL